MPARLEHARRLRCHNAAVLGVRYTSDGLYCMSCGADRKVVLWNPSRSADATGCLVIKEYIGPHSREVSSVAIAKDSARFTSCSGNNAYVWDVSTGAVVKRLEGHAGVVNDVAFAGLDDGLLVTASYDNTARIWDMRSASRTPIQTMDDFKDSVTSLAVSRDCVLAGSVDGSLRTYDIRRGLANKDDFDCPVTSVAVSGDGACVAASCLDSSVRLLEIVSRLLSSLCVMVTTIMQASGTQLNTYKGHTHSTYSIESCFSHDDAHVASCSEDGRVVRDSFIQINLSAIHQVLWRLVEADVVAELRQIHE